MKEEALKLADRADSLAIELPADWSSGEPKNVMTDISAMIRRLVEELDEKNYRILELTKRYKALDRDDVAPPKQLEFHSIAGMKSQYYEGMVEATVAIGTDYTLSLICDEEVKDKVAEMFLPQTKPLSDDEIRQLYIEMMEAKSPHSQSFFGFAKAIEERHGIK